jgi:hypothetical protein
MKHWWFQDILLKLTALGLAVALWAYVGSSQVLERKMDLKAVFTDLPSGALLTEDVKSTVSFVLVGRREKILPLDPAVLKAVVSLKGLPVPVKDYPVRFAVQGIPKGVALDAAPVLISLQSGAVTNKKDSSAKKR